MNTNKLAILGGAKTITREGPHFPWPMVTASTEAAVTAQMRESVSIYNRSGVIARFEDRWSRYHGRRHSLAVNSGTNGLLTMFIAAGLEAGDEVICPGYTFYATCTPLLFTGAVPVLADSDASGNIDVADVERLITPRTKAVVITHMWGVPCDMRSLVKLCDEHGLMLLEDCSHAHGALYDGKTVGSFGHAAVWSLQGQKIVTGGEGGIFSTDSEELYVRANLLGHYNKRCLQEIPDGHPLRRFAVTGMGLKLRAHPFAMAMAEEQFSHLDEWLEQKRLFARRMIERLEGVRGLGAPIVPPGAAPAWYGFVMQYREEELSGLSIERFHQALVAEGATEADLPRSTCPLNQLPLFQEPGVMFPAYRSSGTMARPCPVAERFAKNALKLPVWVRKEDEPLVEAYMDAVVKVAENHEQLL